MNIINPYRFGAGATGLLADYGGAAAAFSLRQLISTWTGDVVEVRRDGGSPSTDTFTATEVSDGTLATWVGAGNNGYVRTWYDQSGNGFDVTQTTNGDQPIIVSSGSLVTSNGEAAIDFDGTNHYLQNAGNISYNGGVSWYAVTDIDVVTITERLWGDDITGQQGFCIYYLSASAGYQWNDNGTGFKALVKTNHATVQELSSLNFDDSTGDYEYASNGSNTTGTLAGWTGPIDSPNTANVGVMGSGNGNQLANGKLQELIIYPNDQSANRTGIESNINAHYSIY
jgi:hypothetical protein